MSLKKRLVEVCHKVYSKGFVAAYDGNISARTENNTVLITRSGICKGDVSEKDIVEIDFFVAVELVMLIEWVGMLNEEVNG